MMNLAMLAKLGWRILIKKDSLWVKVLMCKYVKDELTPEKLLKKTSSSNAWRGIIATSSMLI